MLAISPLRSNKDENNKKGGTTKMETNFCLTTNDEFLDFSGSNLLDSIDFDDLFMGIHNTDGLPDLEMDPELLAEFSLSGEDDSSSKSIENIVSPNSFFDGNIGYVLDGLESGHNNVSGVSDVLKSENDDNNNDNGSIGKNKIEDVEIQSKKKGLGSESVTTLNSSSIIDKGKVHKKHKSSSNSKVDNVNKNNNNDNSSNQGKRKTKVDWTPELHRRFVQAVEQLGVDKAVPSRILELMGIDCLTRHNIASHLQKYRSHRKHLLAREAEAANWTQKRQMYGVVVGGAKGGANISPWPHPPTIGFPPMTTMHHPYRPLHVWGHPSMDPHARMPMWPKQVVPPTTAPLPLPWTPNPPPADPAFWHPSHHRRLTVQPVATVPVPGIPPHAVYRPEHGVPPSSAPPSGTAIALDPHPESVDAALGDVLAKPWLPLPIGLKPPSMDSVFVELQRQGITKVPPSST
ncbi:hypothetical protein RND81_11G106200 [Saponaria officinalis]|uniref:HTH myb-type domain-containing protein n=1 Tax=Saponaria officinalis TaxID=3572 RepID=A0AAW1HKJ2_SAPOF